MAIPTAPLPVLGSRPGRVAFTPWEQVSFPTIDEIQISALFGVLDDETKNRTVILVHELGTGKEQWLQNTSLFVDLLEGGYNVLAIDLRGHGGTSLPDGRLQISLEDLEDSYLDVSAAVSWLQARPEVDAGRVAVIGDGVGGNIAFVIIGAIPQRIKAAVALSPGIWVGQDALPAVIGAGIQSVRSPFDPLHGRQRGCVAPRRRQGAQLCRFRRFAGHRNDGSQSDRFRRRQRSRACASK